MSVCSLGGVAQSTAASSRLFLLSLSPGGAALCLVCCRGEIVHSSSTLNEASWKGKKALVVGSNNSAQVTITTTINRFSSMIT